MRRACFSRCKEASRRREAHFPKLSQHGFKAERDVSLDVFKEDPFWFDLSDDPRDVWPYVTLVVGSLSLSRHAEWLAGVSGEDGVDRPAPRLPVEGGDVIPDWGGGEVSGALRCDDAVPWVFGPFDPAAGVEFWLGKHEAKIEASGSGAQG